MVYFEWTCGCKLKSTNQSFTLEQQSLIEKEMISNTEYFERKSVHGILIKSFVLVEMKRDYLSKVQTP